MPFEMLAVRTALAVATKPIRAAWIWVTGSATHLLIVAFAGALLWGAIERRSAQDQGRRADTAENGRKADRRAYETAQAAATAQARAAKLAEDTRLSTLKDAADHATQPAHSAALDSADRYAASHRVLRCDGAPARGASGGTDLPGATPAPGSANASAAPSDMVAISRADLNACSLNTADLGVAYGWAQSLEKTTP
jgi:hypothetical protein